jgi:hypothetical protein
LLYLVYDVSSAAFFIFFSFIFFPLTIYVLVWPRGVGKNSGVPLKKEEDKSGDRDLTPEEIEAALARMPVDFVPPEATTADSALDEHSKGTNYLLYYNAFLCRTTPPLSLFFFNFAFFFLCSGNGTQKD